MLIKFLKKLSHIISDKLNPEIKPFLIISFNESTLD